MNTDLRLFLK